MAGYDFRLSQSSLIRLLAFVSVFLVSLFILSLYDHSHDYLQNPLPFSTESMFIVCVLFHCVAQAPGNHVI